MGLLDFFKKKEDEDKFIHDFDMENTIPVDFVLSYKNIKFNQFINQNIKLKGYCCKKCGKMVWCEDDQKDFINKNGCIGNIEIIKQENKGRKRRDPIRWYNET